MGFFEHYLTVWVFPCIVVGVLIEVPVMLAVANFVNRSNAWYETMPGILSYDEYCPTTGIHPPGCDRCTNPTYM
jgi:ACR3 family arsenite efflux pump ArsB